MRSHFLIVLVVGVSIAATAATAATAAEPPLTVYAYDSFLGKSSLGQFVADRFKKKTGAETKFISFGSAVEALNQLALEGKSTRADLIIGIDSNLVSRALELKAFEKNDRKRFPKLRSDLSLDTDFTFVPFDFGYLAIVYDSRRVTGLPPTSGLKQFSENPFFAKRLAIEDPRTSSIGLSFLAWTYALGSDQEAETLWKALDKQIVNIFPGWSGAYGFFLKKEADFVVSYTTSPAYHRENEKTDAVRALVFPEGNYRQVEGAGILKTSKQVARAREWLDLLLSADVQAELPTKQWMYPAVEGVKLPPSFEKLPKVSKSVSVEPSRIEASKKEWLSKWTLWMAKVK